MPDPATATYLGMPGYVVLWVCVATSFFLFGRRAAFYVRMLRSARPDNRMDDIPRRVWLFAKNVLGQGRMFSEPFIGPAHFWIFWAFVFYAAGFCWNLLRGLFPSLPIHYADEVPWMAFAMEAMGILALGSLMVAAVRRYAFTPARLEKSRDAALILSLITILLLSFLGGEGAKTLREGASSAWMPAGALVGSLWAELGVTAAGAGSLFLAMWWIHTLTVLGFLAYLPYSKHLHLLASPFGVFFASLQNGSLTPGTDGATRLEDFTWRELFNALACAECGRCDRSCPAYNSGSSLTPQTMVHHVKDLIRTSGSSESSKPHNGDGEFVGGVVSRDEIWACTACYSCTEQCPVFNEHVPMIVEMRRHLVSEGDVEPGLQDAMMNLTRYGNSFGKSPRHRIQWTTLMEPRIKDARKEPVECLWVTGDYASYDPRLKEVTQSAARVFQQAGLDFGILYDSEQNAGNDVRRAGEEGLFEMLMEKNQAAMEKATFENIVTTDPHTYHALKNEYNWTDWNGSRRPNVLHHTELLDQLFRSGQLQVREKLDATVTYHDGCYLGRCNEVYEAPRRLLRSLGLKLVEMPRNRRKSYCCGAGGGRIWMEDVPGIKERPAESRVREAAQLPGVSTLVVACPKDLVMFQDALKTTGLDDRLVVKEVAELVAAAAGQ